MEQSIKLIKIQKQDKKQLYKDILSSSKKVHEIIKKTKINKSKFYKPRVNKQTNDSLPYLKNDINHKQVDPIKELEKIVYKKVIHPPPYLHVEQFVKPSVETNNPFNKKTCINNNYFKHEKKLTLEKKTLKKNVYGKYKSKKIKNYKPINILNYYNASKNINMKIFTQKEIDKFINVLTYYSDYEQHTKIHKYIKKLNKYQTLQILYELTLIKSKSNGPIPMLKNILYNYFCCNINIIR
jgi:hypothetical protein